MNINYIIIARRVPQQSFVGEFRRKEPKMIAQAIQQNRAWLKGGGTLII